MHRRKGVFTIGVVYIFIVFSSHRSNRCRHVRENLSRNVLLSLRIAGNENLHRWLLMATAIRCNHYHFHSLIHASKTHTHRPFFWRRAILAEETSWKLTSSLMSEFVRSTRKTTASIYTAFSCSYSLKRVDNFHHILARSLSLLFAGAVPLAIAIVRAR